MNNLTILEIKQIIDDETNKQLSQFTEESIREEVAKKFKEGMQNTLARIMGFEIGSWNEWRVDHCNGRLSVVSEYISDRARQFIYDNIDKCIKNYKFNDHQIKGIKKDYANQINYYLRDSIEDHAKKKAEKIIDKLFGKLDKME